MSFSSYFLICFQVWFKMWTFPVRFWIFHKDKPSPFSVRWKSAFRVSQNPSNPTPSHTGSLVFVKNYKTFLCVQVPISFIRLVGFNNGEFPIDQSDVWDSSILLQIDIYNLGAEVGNKMQNKPGVMNSSRSQILT